jgi:hypothetical protein
MRIGHLLRWPIQKMVEAHHGDLNNWSASADMRQSAEVDANALE